MLENSLDKIAEQIIALDEASLSQLRKKYLGRVVHFEPTKEWEKSVIIYYIINGVITKNNLFNRYILEEASGENQGVGKGKTKGAKKGTLKVIK